MHNWLTVCDFTANPCVEHVKVLRVIENEQYQSKDEWQMKNIMIIYL